MWNLWFNMCLIENISLIYINLFVMKLKNINNKTIILLSWDIEIARINIFLIKKWKKYKKSVDVYLNRWYIITCPWERGKNLKS